MSVKGNILIGITGGIAAYKTLSLIRLFVKNGYEVKVAATKNALNFVTPLSIETLSNNTLYADMFALPINRNVEHIALSDWADIVVVAPASANLIGKLAAGIADDALTTLLLATKKKIYIAPAMNERMFSHFSVQKNLTYLSENGIQIIEPEEGFLACQAKGKGRMAEPEDIFNTINDVFEKKDISASLTALVTAGPTYEPIDAVRFIGNYSSGLMGFSLAEALAEKGIQVNLVTGPTHFSTHHHLIKRIDVKTANEMFAACQSLADKSDILIMAAAVSDYTPESVSIEKIKKTTKSIQLTLNPTVDILKTLGTNKKENQIVIGFALETNNELENAKKKLKEKKVDYIVLNSLRDKGAGFEVNTNKVSLIDADENVVNIPLQSKKNVAKTIVKHILEQYKIKNKEQ